jgi:hypothetical protein
VFHILHKATEKIERNSGLLHHKISFLLLAGNVVLIIICRRELG